MYARSTRLPDLPLPAGLKGVHENPLPPRRGSGQVPFRTLGLRRGLESFAAARRSCAARLNYRQPRGAAWESG